MSKLIQPKQTRKLEERYEMLRKTLAHYLLLQVGTFVGLAGFDSVGPAMNMLTDMKANLKVEEIKAKNQGSTVEALSQNLAESRRNSRAWIPRKASRRTRLLNELLREIAAPQPAKEFVSYCCF